MFKDIGTFDQSHLQNQIVSFVLCVIVKSMTTIIPKYWIHWEVLVMLLLRYQVLINQNYIEALSVLTTLLEMCEQILGWSV